MKLIRPLSAAALVLVSGLGLSSCLNAPTYPIEPSIEFSKITVTHIPRIGGAAARDTLQFFLNFKDGDGDLGLSDTDINSAPYNATTGGHNNRGFSYNYFIQPFLNDGTGKFIKFVTPGGTAGEYDGRYLRLDGFDAKPAPLKGELRYKLPITLTGLSYKAGQEFRFEISILDRGLHESNVITTSVVKLGQ